MRTLAVCALLLVACKGSGDQGGKAGKELVEGLADAQSAAYDAVHKLRLLGKGEDITTMCKGAGDVIADADKASKAAAPTTAPAGFTACFAAVDASRTQLRKAVAAAKSAQTALANASTAEAQWGSCGTLIDTLQQLHRILCDLDAPTESCKSEAKRANVESYVLGASPLSVECTMAD
jgi:hypothetical protein